MSKFNRANMIEGHLEQSSPVPNSTPHNQKVQKSFVFELKKFKFLNQENGFFIAEARTKENSDVVPAIWRGRFSKESFTVKGTALSLASLDHVGSTIECDGDWVLDPKFGLQYQFQWAREAMPSSLEALEKYLSQGRLKSIGPALAKVIVEKWGMKTIDTLTQNPEELLTVSGITQTKLDIIKKDWAVKQSSYHLTSFFGLYGIGEVWIERIIDAMGIDNLEARVRANPYSLTQIDGIGFATADKMALSLGLSPQSPQRSEAMLMHLLKEYTDRQGHTARPANEWLKEAESQLQVSQAVLQPIAQDVINKQMVIVRNLVVDKKDGTPPDRLPSVQCVSLRKEFMAERGIANNLKRLLSSSKSLSSTEETLLFQEVGQKMSSLDPSQIDAVLGVLSSPLSVLTGGPGTGKTTTLKSVIDIAEKFGWKVVLAAPTGRASKRMEEAIGRPASTIHRCLKFNPKSGFMQNKDNPLLGDLFVVDEASMIDNALGASWLSAIPAGARVLFVGDVDQLPSVGAGNFLKDIIESKIFPVNRLTRVHRQTEGSLIAEAAQKILSGRSPDFNGDLGKDDFAWVCPPHGLSSSEINEFISNQIEDVVKSLLAKGVKRADIQVLSPQRDGLVGVSGLNDSLRWLLNEQGRPRNPDHEEEPVVLGDRLLVTKNNYDKEIFNGDMGVVQKIDFETGEVELKMEDDRVVSLERMERKNLTLGYAITVHKSQGGERPYIIMPCSPSHTFSLNKNLIYTGITRARKQVIVVGSPKTLQNALRKEETMYRLTGLVSEISKAIPTPTPVNPTKSFKSFSPN